MIFSPKSFWGKKNYFKKYLGVHLGAAKFPTRVLSLILKGAVLLKHTEQTHQGLMRTHKHTGQELMRLLSIRIRN
jgi:hypothetical protein